MGSGQNADFASNLANFVKGAAIWTTPILEHFIAEDALLQAVKYFAGFGMLSLIRK